MSEISLYKPQLATIAFNSINPDDVSLVKLTPGQVTLVTTQGNHFIVAEDTPAKMAKPVGKSYNRKISTRGPSLNLRASFEAVAASIREEGHYLTKVKQDYRIKQKEGTKPQGSIAIIGEHNRHPEIFYYSYEETWINEANIKALTHQKSSREEAEIFLVGNNSFKFNDYDQPPKDTDLNALLSRIDQRAEAGKIFKYISGIEDVTPHRPGYTLTTYLQLDNIGEINLDIWPKRAKLSAVFTDVKESIRSESIIGHRFDISIFPLADETNPEQDLSRHQWGHVRIRRERENAIALRDQLRELRPDVQFYSKGEDGAFTP